MPDRTITAEQSQQLENTVHHLERELNNLYLQAGKSMLEAAEQTAKKANTLTEKMIAAKKLLNRVQNQTRCPVCQSFNPPINRYCGCCGTELLKERNTQ
ncbi:MAG: hypothetical protein QM308_05910 [Bacillota bacterium]|nr:hypothetical protein [Bacillota bacterium]